MYDDYANKRVTIMGLGHFGGGVGAARFFAERGAAVTVTDLKGPEDLADSIEHLRGYGISYRLRRHRRADFLNADIVVPSPAVPRQSPLLALAREHGAQLDTEMNLFVRRCPAGIIGVTGTNGKTTTAAMLGHILQSAGRTTWLGGNIGRSLLADLPAMRPGDHVVLEMSSFQLEWLPQTGLCPHLSIVTNLAPDHLDRYRSVDEYYAAKWQIAAGHREGDWLVLNADCPELADWAGRAPSRVLPFSFAQELAEGVFCRGDAIMARLDGQEQYLCPIDALKLPGRHNVENALAAAAGCVIVGLPPAQIEAGIRSFTGVEHRIEFVAEVDGVRYYNDSKATTPDSTIVALRAFQCPIVLIAGGSGKGLSFEPMARAMHGRVRGGVLIGKTADEIAACMRAERSEIEPVRCASLHEAVLAARKLAQPGDVVLLSPADASYDMFRNYEERGELFRHEVHQLASREPAEQRERG